jgi:Na+:H+ antiporter, NhaA family
MPWRHIVDFFVNNAILVVLGAAGGLLWANVAFSNYHWFTHGLHFVVNDVETVFLFAIAANQVFEDMLPGGPLSSVRRSAVPLFAATGGMVVPALLYLAVSRPRPVGSSSG